MERARILHFGTARMALVALGAGAALASCSGGGSALQPRPSPTPTQAAFSGFAAASNAVCVTPATTSQTVNLPSTAGVSAMISVGAFAADATGCDSITIATGADAVVADAKAHFFQILGSDAATPTPVKPLLTISVGEGLEANSLFGYETIVSGMQLNVSSNLNFPDGTYYATITSPAGNVSSITGTITFTAKDGVLVVSTLTLSNGKSFPIVIVADTASIITLYPRGVTPPETTPAPSPTPTASGSASPSPSPSASGSAAPTPTPPSFATASPQAGAYGNPPPAQGSQIGFYSESGSTNFCAGVSQSYCNDSNIPMSQQFYATGANEEDFNGGAIDVPAGFSGTISFSANIGYMGIYPPFTNTCPSDYGVNAGADGSGTIVVPEGDPFANGSAASAYCGIQYFTNPPGKAGTANDVYYEEDVYLYPTSGGVPCGNDCSGDVRRRNRSLQLSPR